MRKRIRLVLVTLSSIGLALGAAACGGSGGGAGGGGGATLSISVTTSTNQTTLSAGQTVNVVANVMHAGGNSNVTWSLTSTGCLTNCGVLSDSTASAVNYVAPEFVGSSFEVTITATAAADTTKMAFITVAVDKSFSADCPSGSEAVLNGQYALLLRGGGSSTSYALAGTITADGEGDIWAGSEDIVSTSSAPQTNLQILAGSSLYSVGPDNRGCLGIVDTQNDIHVYRFALGGLSGGVATEGRIIEFDDSTGDGTRAEGMLAKQDQASFLTAAIDGNYAFGLAGPDSTSHRQVSAGMVEASAGLITGGNMDVDDAGSVTSNFPGLMGTYVVTPQGRGTMTLDIGGGSNFVLYVVSSSEFFAVSTDPVDTRHAIQSGYFLQQAPGGFDSSALNAPSVVYTNGLDQSLSAPVATIGSLTSDGAGNATLVLDQNDGGNFTPTQSSSVTYVVGANGRTTVSGLGKNPPVLYLVAANSGFVVGTDSNSTFGRFEPQTGSPFTNASLSGRYAYGTEGTRVGSRLTAVGSIDFPDGVNDQAEEDDATPGGLMPNISEDVTQYSFLSSTSPPGRGTLDAAGDLVAYIISPTKLVYLDRQATQPRVVIVEQ